MMMKKLKFRTYLDELKYGMRVFGRHEIFPHQEVVLFHHPLLARAARCAITISIAIVHVAHWEWNTRIFHSIGIAEQKHTLLLI